MPIILTFATKSNFCNTLNVTTVPQIICLCPLSFFYKFSGPGVKLLKKLFTFFYLQFFKVDIVIENVFRQVLQLVIVQAPISKRRQLVYVTA